MRPHFRKGNLRETQKSLGREKGPPPIKRGTDPTKEPEWQVIDKQPYHWNPPDNLGCALIGPTGPCAGSVVVPQYPTPRIPGGLEAPNYPIPELLPDWSA